MDAEEFSSVDQRGLPEFVRDPSGVIRRRWPWMLVALLAGLLLTAGVGVLWRPHFMATATLMVSSQKITEDFVRPTVEDDSLGRINAMVGEALTQRSLASLVEKRDLYPELRKEIPLNDVAMLMRRDIEIGQSDQTESSTGRDMARLYSISYRALDPEVAATVANDLADLFTAANSRMRERQAELATQFLQRELDEAKTALLDQNREIREYKEKYRGELPEELESNLRKLERLQLQRQSLSVQMAEAESRLASYLSTTDENSPEARLEELRGKLAAEEAIHTDEHPNVAALRRQVASLEKQLGAKGAAQPTRSRMAEATQNELSMLRKELASVETDQKELDARVARAPARQEELSAMEERVAVLRDNYQEFLRKVKEAELSRDLEQAQQGAQVVVLDRASPPLEPERSRGRYLLLGVLASFTLALGTGMLLEIADPVALSSGQVESLLGMPVLGSVSRIG